MNLDHAAGVVSFVQDSKLYWDAFPHIIYVADDTYLTVAF